MNRFLHRALLPTALAISLILASVWAVLAAVPLQAHVPLVLEAPLTFIVNDPRDAPDANLNDNLCESTLGAGVCTLRAAIMQANAYGGDDIIEIRADTYLFTEAGADEDMSVSGDLDVTDNVTIQGAGATSTIIDAQQLDRLFHIIGAIDVQLSGVTLRNGLTGLGEDGGAILNSSNANTTFINSIVEDNHARQWGGGIANGDSAQIVLDNVEVRNNTADVLAGGIDNHDGIVIVRQSEIVGNVAVSSSGGGIYNDGSLRVENTLIQGNRAKVDGGGIFNFDSLTLERSTLAENSAEGDAGGLLNWGDADLRNVTITDNSAGRDAGGYFNLGNSNVVHATIADNSAVGQADGLFQDGFLNLTNTILADTCVRYNHITSYGNNIDAGTSCVLTHANDMSNTASLLEPLMDNGGFTPTRALQVGSPATDAANLAGCLNFDQREIPRPQGAGCDIGAYEGNEDDLTLSKRDVTDPVLASQDVIYQLIVRNLGDSSASNVIVTDTLPIGMTYVSAVGNGWTCNETSGVVSCTRPQIVVDASETITVVATAPSVGGVITNTAIVTATSVDSIASNNSASVTTTVLAISDLAVTVQSNPQQVLIGQPLTFTANVENLGVSSAENVVMEIELPVGKVDLTSASAVGSGWTCSTNVTILRCTRPALAVGPAPEIIVTVTPLVADATLSAPVDVSSSTLEPDITNNAVTAVLGSATLARADLSIALSDAPDPVATAQVLSYTLMISNTGPNIANYVTVTHQLDTLTTFLTVSGVGWSCVHAASVVTCSTPTLAMGDAAPIVVTVQTPNDVATLHSSATVATTTIDPQATNNLVTTDTEMVASADLSITMNEAPDPVAIGANVTYSITIENAGPSIAVANRMTMTLPSEMTYLNDTSTDWNCFNSSSGLICSRASLA
ncbi:MAG: choice-of-anchor Q domain-containing protein, partial [Candidatus Promineifilaceae bacterium]